MRILHVEKFLDHHGSAAGGVGAYIRLLEPELTRRGHELHSFGCVRVAADDPAMPTYRDFVHARSPLAFWRLMHSHDAAKKLDALLRRERFDVAHLHNIYHHLTPSILPVLAKHGVGMVMTVHDYRQLCGEELFWRWGLGDSAGRWAETYQKEARRRCSGPGGLAMRLKHACNRLRKRYTRHIGRFICPSEFMRASILDAGVSEDQAVVIRNPIATMQSARILSVEPRVLLYVGRLCVEKSPEMMLALAERLPGEEIVLAGDGPMRDWLEQTAKRKRLTNVTFTGHLAAEELAGWYARAAAVVVTSRCMENSPAAMLEAMAAGQCVVVPDQPALREWVQDGQTGRVYPTGDEAALVAVCGELLTDSAMADTMGRAAAESVRRQHDLRSIVDAVEFEYQRVKERTCVSQ